MSSLRLMLTGASAWPSRNTQQKAAGGLIVFMVSGLNCNTWHSYLIMFKHVACRILWGCSWTVVMLYQWAKVLLSQSCHALPVSQRKSFSTLGLNVPDAWSIPVQLSLKPMRENALHFTALRFQNLDGPSHHAACKRLQVLNKRIRLALHFASNIWDAMPWWCN